MKIISKYKDYYDFLQGIKGIDPLVLLDRSKGSIIDLKYLQEYDYFHFIIFGRGYRLIWWNKKWVSDDELFSLNKKLGSDGKVSDIKNEWELKHAEEEREKDKRRWWENALKATNYCPIILIDKYGGYITFPRLSDFQFGKIIPPESMWNALYNWLSVKPDPVNNQTNVEKIESHGFDKKTSFRPKIKT